MILGWNFKNSETGSAAAGPLTIKDPHGRSVKALDLLRDPRCTVHSPTSNRDGSEGDFKVYGRAVEIQDLDTRQRYCEAMYEKIGWKPAEPEFHLFSVDVESAALLRFKDEEFTHQLWKAG